MLASLTSGLVVPRLPRPCAAVVASMSPCGSPGAGSARGEDHHGAEQGRGPGAEGGGGGRVFSQRHRGDG